MPWSSSAPGGLEIAGRKLSQLARNFPLQRPSMRVKSGKVEDRQARSQEQLQTGCRDVAPTRAFVISTKTAEPVDRGWWS